MNRRLSAILLPILLFCMLAALVLLVLYPDLLYTAQERNEFFANRMFLEQTLRNPFGVMTYLGCYLTQFFYHPGLGVTLLLMIWVASYGVLLKVTNVACLEDSSVTGNSASAKKSPLAENTSSAKGNSSLAKKTSSAKGSFSSTEKTSSATGYSSLLGYSSLVSLTVIPLGALLCSITDVGYWVYVLPLHGYWFSMSLSFLIILLMLWGAKASPVKWRTLWWIVLAASYPLLGVWTLMGGVCLLAMRLSVAKESRTAWWMDALGMLLLLVAPLCWGRTVYTDVNLLTIMKAGLPYFETNTDSSLRPSYPFILLAISTLVLLSLSRTKLVGWTSRTTNMIGRWIPVGLTAMLLAGMLYLLSFRDYNYQAEMRMTRAAVEDDWNTVLTEAAAAETPSETMVALKNIALMNTGELGNRSFSLGNNGIGINNPDSLNVNIMQIAAPIVFYHYGKMLYAMRWCMENTVYHGFSPYYLKMFVRAAEATGETALVQRYTHLLHQTTFHGQWTPRPVTTLVQDLQTGFSDVIDTDNNLCLGYLEENFSMAYASNRPVVRELSLFCSLLLRDARRFWPAFNAYYSQLDGQSLPLSYQEAYVILQERFPVQLPYQVDVSPSVRDNYNRFCQMATNLSRQGLNNVQMVEQLRPAYGNTYWWYLLAEQGDE